MSNNLPKCPRCNGSKWVKGLVGGIYECPDCWAHEQKCLNKEINEFVTGFGIAKESTKNKRGRPPKSKGFNHGQED